MTCGAVWAAARFVPPEPVWLPGLACAAAALIAPGVLLAAHHRFAAAPAQRLARGLRLIREARTRDLPLEITNAGGLEGLSRECAALVETLRETRREVRSFAEAEAAEAGNQKAWLESILQNLNEGVFVCNHQHRIMLYNAAAVSLVGAPEHVGLGRDLGAVLDIGPLGHSLSRLELRLEADPEARHEISAPFVCSTRDGAQVFHGRMALLIAPGGSISGYLVTLVDGSQDHALLAGGDAMRHTLSGELAPRLDEIRRAAERLVSDALTAGEREMLARLAADASREASEITRAVSAGLRELLLGHATMVDVYALDLAKLVARKLPPDAGVRTTLIGTPEWLLADSLALVEALETLVLQIAESRGVEEVFLETVATSGGGVDLEISWRGDPATEVERAAWCELDCFGAKDHQRLGNVLERHGSRLEAAPARRPGNAMLRLPLRAPQRRRQTGEPARRPAARAEFYDANLMAAHQGDTELAQRRMRDLHFVVFDCEMTGLQPGQGDEIIQIGAVPVVRNRILSGEATEWLVNPGRPIPPASIQFHGLTDADVRDKPSILEVLPEFHTFCGDAVLVAHNAAFDMRFLTIKEKAAGVRFDNPVLDTMLISLLLDGPKEDHSLDGLSGRYGISITGRHTALGDTIATADLLVKMIERLEAKGFGTFGDVMRETNMAAELRHRGAVFAHGTGAGG